MLVLVVGGTSAIGRAVATELRLAGADVVTAGRRDADVPLDLAGDLPDRLVDAGGRALRCDVVVNAAATIGGVDPAQEEQAWRVNADGAGAVARLAIAAGAHRMIQLSTAYAAFPERYPGPPCYPRSKAGGEIVAAEVAQQGGLALCAVRLTHVYDAQGACRRNQELPYRFAELADADESIEIHGDGSARRDYLFLTDATRALRLAVASEVAGTVTTASPAMLTMAEIAEVARAAFGSTAPIRLRPDVPGPVGMPRIGELNNGEGWRLLGGTPRVSLEVGFACMRAARSR